MNEDWNEDDSEEFQEIVPGQFSLRTLMTVVTVAAVICSFVMWLGLVPVVLITVNAAGTFLGLLICSYIDLGFSFADLKWDIIKCFIIAALVFLPIFIIRAVKVDLDLFFIARSYAIIAVMFYFFGVKLAWLELEKPELFVVSVSSFFCTMVGISILAR